MKNRLKRPLLPKSITGFDLRSPFYNCTRERRISRENFHRGPFGVVFASRASVLVRKMPPKVADLPLTAAFIGSDWIPYGLAD